MRRRDWWNLVWSFTIRQVAERYRGSALGFLWAFINPLVALALWTFLFTTILRLRHEGTGGAAGYATMLWAGMVPWLAFSEAINGAMSCIRNHSNLVKRTLFPIEVLPLSSVFAGLIHGAIALSILIPVLLLRFHSIPKKAVLLPVVMVTQLIVTTAIAYPVSILTTLVRDFGPVIANLLTTLLYLTPVIYPLESVPEPYRTWMLANPLAVVVESYRHLLLDGAYPSWTLLGAQTVVSGIIVLVARRAFGRQRKTFAEIL